MHVEETARFDKGFLEGSQIKDFKNFRKWIITHVNISSEVLVRITI